MLDDGETETGAGDPAAARLVGAVETLSQSGQVFALDAGALVFDAQPDGFDVGIMRDMSTLIF